MIPKALCGLWESVDSWLPSSSSSFRSVFLYFFCRIALFSILKTFVSFKSTFLVVMIPQTTMETWLLRLVHRAVHAMIHLTVSGWLHIVSNFEFPSIWLLHPAWFPWRITSPYLIICHPTNETADASKLLTKQIQMCNYQSPTAIAVKLS